LVGAVTVYLVDQLIFKNLIPSGHQLVLGALLVGMIIFSPGGLVPLLRKALGKISGAGKDNVAQRAREASC
jgi:branched-chain amino acid transport system permease protein